MNFIQSSGLGTALNNWLTLVIAPVFVIFVFLEIMGPIQRYAFESRKPVLIAHWTPGNGYTGVTSMYSFGNELYILNSKTGVMLEYRLLTGEFLRKYYIPTGFYSMARLSNGDILALSAGNTIIRYPAGSENTAQGISVSGASSLGYVATDSKDNIIVVDNAKNTLIKYDSGFNRLFEFGRGILHGAKKVYTGPKDSLYVIDCMPEGGLYVVIFSEKGKFLKRFKVMEGRAVTGLESLVVTVKGNVYINSYAKDKILYFSRNGNLVADFGATSDDESMIKYPASICGWDDRGTVIVSSEILVVQDVKI